MPKIAQEYEVPLPVSLGELESYWQANGIDVRRFPVSMDFEAPNGVGVQITLNLTVEEVGWLGEALRSERTIVGRYNERSELALLATLMGWDETLPEEEEAAA